MAISDRTRNPQMILLAGPRNIVDDIAAGEAITPGMLVELYDDSGVNKWRKHNTATEQPTLAVMLNRPERNEGIDTACAIGDLIPVAFLAPGNVINGLVPSGQTIANAAKLQSNGGGTFKAASATTAAANVARFQSLQLLGAVVANTRCRIQVIC